jgi:Fe2+ or Zn2+ uptake regulation protein
MFMIEHIEKLRSSGLKITPRRKAIIEIFQKVNGHMTPEDVWEELKDRFDECGLPSIYRNLAELEECGILTKIQQFDRKRHYALCEAKDNCHHHHIVCVQCGKVGDVEACGVEQIKKVKGFKILSHYVQLNGICAACQKE